MPDDQALHITHDDLTSVHGDLYSIILHTQYQVVPMARVGKKRHQFASLLPQDMPLLSGLLSSWVNSS